MVSKMRRHLDQVDQIRYHVIRRDLVRHGRWASAGRAATPTEPRSAMRGDAECGGAASRVA